MGINPLATSESMPGVQGKNIAWLKAQTEYLKAQNEFVKEVNKSKKETWQAMTESVTTMERFSSAGGFSMLFAGSISRFKTNLQNQIEGAFTPITNALTQFVSDLLDEATPLGKALNTLIDIIGDALGEMTDLFKGEGVPTFTDPGPTAPMENMFDWWNLFLKWLGILGGGGGGGAGLPPIDPSPSSGRLRPDEQVTW